MTTLLLLLQLTFSALTHAAIEKDPHSFSNPEAVQVTHVDLTLTVDFEKKILKGRARLQLNNKTRARTLTLDNKNLTIKSITQGKRKRPARFTHGEAVHGLGTPLHIAITPRTSTVTIEYETAPDAEALQWLAPEQTAGKQHPFLYSQSQSIAARSWIPLQDTPTARVTYTARITVPKNLLPLMSAQNPRSKNTMGTYTFYMNQPIPPYLMALAVGDIEFRPYGTRTGMYAEPSQLDAAHWEFDGTEELLQKAEALFGSTYAWDRYDMLLMPPSFPFGGMENPRLTFLTPTLIAKDRSLINVVAHELAHSWTGNLITNSNANHFWLNEGFTVYGERRLLETLHGRERSEVQAKFGLLDLKRDLEEFKDKPEFTKLRQDLTGVDPDDAYSNIPYEKGYLFLRFIEETVGRPRFEQFFKSYIQRFAFQSINTDQFLEHLESHLIQGNDRLRTQLNLDQWINEPGLPATLPNIHSNRLAMIETLGQHFSLNFSSGLPLSPEHIATLRGFSTFETVQFLNQLPRPSPIERLEELDKLFSFTTTHNAELLSEWLLLGIKSLYAPALTRALEFVTQVGRGKYLYPLYQSIIDTPQGLELAATAYVRARSGYHAIINKRLEQMFEKAGCESALLNPQTNK